MKKRYKGLLSVLLALVLVLGVTEPLGAFASEESASLSDMQAEYDYDEETINLSVTTNDITFGGKSETKIGWFTVAEDEDLSTVDISVSGNDESTVPYFTEDDGAYKLTGLENTVTGNDITSYSAEKLTIAIEKGTKAELTWKVKTPAGVSVTLGEATEKLRAGNIAFYKDTLFAFEDDISDDIIASIERTDTATDLTGVEIELSVKAYAYEEIDAGDIESEEAFAYELEWDDDYEDASFLCIVYNSDGIIAESEAVEITYPSLDVEVKTVSNGTVATDKTTAKPGETVKITSTASNYYTAKAPVVKDADNNTVLVTKVSGTVYSFTMPKSKVTVTGSFAKTEYTISKSSVKNGSISVSSKAAWGSTVNITATPASGYKVDKVTVKQGSKDVTTTAKNGKYSFTMPKGNVTVSATFVATTYSVKVTAVKGATVTTNVSKASKDATVTITAKAADGYKLTAVTVTDSSNKKVVVNKNKKDATKYTFKMPNKAVTVKATVKEAPYVKANATKITLCKGQKFGGLTYKVASYDKITSYTSSNKNIVAVDSKGNLTAKAKGSATITVKTKKGASVKVTVKVDVKKIETTKITLTNVTKGKLSLKKNEKFTVKYELNPITSQDKVTFKSSDTKIATIDSKGKITPKKAGKTTITVTSGKKKATFALTVK